MFDGTGIETVNLWNFQDIHSMHVMWQQGRLEAFHIDLSRAAFSQLGGDGLIQITHKSLTFFPASDHGIL